MRPYRKYTDNDIIEIVKRVRSISGLLRELNLKVAGGNFATIKRRLSILKLDTSHLIKLRGHKCELCLNIDWLGRPIPLELHHLNGDRTNNQPENLQLLCCNCHATTDSWRGKKNLAKKLENSNL